MATAITNEQRLDEAERIIQAVIKDVRYNITRYNHKDYAALLEAWVALNKVTLRPDSDFDIHQNHQTLDAIFDCVICSRIIDQEEG